jgi:hypothetical protein
MKLFANRYVAAFLISPLLIALAAFFFIRHRADAQMLDAKIRAVRSCKDTYSRDKDSYGTDPATTRVTYSNLATIVVNEADLKVTGTVTYETAEGKIKSVEMECIVASN